MNNELVIIRAPSGFGKSTYVQKHFVPKGYIQCEADSFFMKDGVYQFDRTKLGAAHQTCQRDVRKNLTEGRNVVVSNTNTTQREVNEYIRIAQECNVPYRIIRLAKQFKNVHNVPDEIVEAMKARMVPIEGETVLAEY
jgi:predicted kinase